MDNYEEKILKVLKKEVSKPISYNFAIKNAFSKKESKKEFINPFYKIITISCCCLFAISGIVFATYTIYEKVWKEPVITTQEDKNQEIRKVTEPITDNELNGLISREKAIEIGYKILETLGYNKINFKTVNIIKGYDSKNHYVLCTETDITNGLLINLNPLNGEFEYFCDNTVIKQDLKSDNITEENANSIATNIYTKLNIITENDNYEILSTKRQNIVSGNRINDMWQVTFAQKYNNNFDNSSSFTTAFSVVNGKTIIYIIKGKNEKATINNPIIISRDEAIKIATNKEKEFSSLDILETNAELSIKKMNIFIYALENNITNENGEYKIDDISRNVWVVEIKHTKDTKPKDTEIETVKQLYDKKYFVDATTGEIIGGEQTEFFNNQT